MDTMMQENENTTILRHDLPFAVERAETILYYQPIIDAIDHQVVAVEALIRWQHPTLGLVSPLDFIPLAEQSGLILPISDWVIVQACQQLKTWQDALKPSLIMAVNISARCFEDPGFSAKVMTVIQEAGIKPDTLSLEITESTIMHHPEQAIKTLQELKSIGVNLAVDDFGTGYSSLSYLKNFPVNTIKIDRSFVRELETDPVNLTLIKAIMMLAEGLSLRAVVEGVETEAQKSLLLGIGVRYMQGFLFSRPLPVDDCQHTLLSF